MSKKASYRHRNTKNHVVAKDLIHTFWVGQRVARSWERTNYVDRVGEQGVVIELPGLGHPGSLLVRSESGKVSNWSPTEAIPLMSLLKNNRDRFRSIAKQFQAQIDALNRDALEALEDEDA